MCGIIGYSGNEKCVPFLLQGLRALEYRGYDSAGITVAQNGELVTVKAKGRLERLEKKLSEGSPLNGSCGIGHTRWATHGEPSDINSHPHTTENVSLVHNGIIENYAEIEELLSISGYTFESSTDTERAAKLLDMFFAKEKDPIRAIKRAVKVLRGSYALGIIFKGYADTVYAIRRDSPLVVAHNGKAGLLSSDIPAMIGHTSSYYRLDEGVIAVIKQSYVSFCDLDGKEIHQDKEKIDFRIDEAQKGGYAHFMLKEINESPEAVRKTLEPRIKDGIPTFGTDVLDSERINSFSSIRIVACGTAMHAGLIGRSAIEQLARMPVTVEIASEFRYREPIVDKDELVILLSQSGETADTLAALRLAKTLGAYTLAIVNMQGSSVAREADSVLYTYAGPEISVASTKAYSVQCALLYLIAIRIAMSKGKLSETEARSKCRAMLSDIPKAMGDVLKKDGEICETAKRLVAAEHAFFIGRDTDCALCAEASLKLKEISYIHSEAYAAGELKHGAISLVTDGIPVIAVATVSRIFEKMLSNIREVKSRGAYVICVCSESLSQKAFDSCDKVIELPNIDEEFALFPAATTLQLLAYHVSAQKELDVDKPRNLAKSVTVE